MASVGESSQVESDLTVRQDVDETGENNEDNVNLNALSRNMFDRVSEYVQGELTTTIEDYKLLEQMNRLTITKYSDMKQIAANVSKSLKDLQVKYESLHFYLEQIDQIEESVTKLEQAAYKLDAYSKRLESKFKHLEKR